MKLLLCAALCLLRASVSVAQTTSEISPPFVASAPWSVVGQWHAVHTTYANWTDTITISADGTFARAEGSTGHWTLTGLQDHFALVLDWKDWPAEIVTLVGPDDFRGKIRGGSVNRGDLGEFTLHRSQQPVVASASKPSVETHRWQQGEPPLRLIRKEEGFCALSLVTGNFRGSREMVKVYVGDDGYWYLGGDSDQDGVAGECIVVRFPGR